MLVIQKFIMFHKSDDGYVKIWFDLLNVSTLFELDTKKKMLDTISTRLIIYIQLGEWSFMSYNSLHI